MVPSLNRLAVLMFTDVVGSTAQRQRLGPERAETQRSMVDQLQLDLIASHEGRLVKHLGDGMMAEFSSVTAAVTAATTLQGELARMNRRLPEPTQIRIGIAAGEVNPEDDDLFGMPVVTAARLCEAARGSSVLVDDVARRLAEGVVGGVGDEPLELELKGIDGVVTAWELTQVQGDELPPLPRALRGDQRFRFVGRDEELSSLFDEWAVAAAGDQRIRFVAGEAGVGKTRLVAELAREVRDQGGTVLYGRNDPDLVVPYQPFAEILRQFVGEQPPRIASTRLGPSASELVRLVPDLSSVMHDLGTPVSSDPETERFRLFEATAQWLSVASAVEPLLLVIDDLHWAAEPTLQLLRHVARSGLPLALMIVGTVRVESPEGPTVDDLVDNMPDAEVGLLTLTGFDESTTLEFIEAAARHPFGDDGPELASVIRQQTAGNALFTRELLLHLAETGVLAEFDGRWAITMDLAELGIPDGIRRIVTERLSRLSVEAQQTMLWCAVIGEVIDFGLLAAVSDLAEPDLLNVAEECAGARLLDEDGSDRFRFQHGLMRSALYQSLGDTRRARLHQRAAESLEDLAGGDPTAHLGELAHHFTLGAGEGVSSKAVRYHHLAGNRALEQLAAPEAVNHYRTALDLLDRDLGEDPIRRCDLLSSLGKALLHSGDPAFEAVLDEAARAARDIGDAKRFGQVVLASSRGSSQTSGHVDEKRVSVIEEALELLDPHPSSLRASLLGALAAELHYGGYVERTAALAEASLEMARSVGDAETIAFVLVQRSAAMRTPELLVSRRADLLELSQVSQELGDPVSEFFANIRLAETAIESARLDELISAIDRAGELVSDLGHSYLELRVLRHRAELAMLQGEVDESGRLLDEMMALSDELGLIDQTVAEYTGNITKVRSAQGRVGETTHLWRQLVDDLGATFLAGLGVVLAEAGEPDEACAIYRQFAADDFESLNHDLTWLHNLSFLAVLCRDFGTAGEAAILESKLSQYSDLTAYAGAGCYGSIAHFLGTLAGIQGEFERASRWFDKADAVNSGLEAPLLDATTRLARADLLDRRGDEDDHAAATELRRAAAETGRRLAAPGIERWATGAATSG